MLVQKYWTTIFSVCSATLQKPPEYALDHRYQVHDLSNQEPF